MVDVVAVNRGQRFVLTDRGDVCPITNMFDAFGDETDDPAEAVTAVAELDADHWLAIDLTQFETVAVN
jgi:hypothetical protein